MSVEKWGSVTNQGTVLTTELNALADGSSATGATVIDNSVNLDRFGVAEFDTAGFGINPTADSPLHLYALPSLDGTNYEDRPTDNYYLGSFVVQANTSAQRIATRRFEMPPFKCKFVLLNKTGQTMHATGNTVTLFTFDRTIN